MSFEFHTFRETPEDFEAWTTIHNADWPDEPLSTAEVKHNHDRWEERHQRHKFFLLHNCHRVGYGQWSEVPWAHRKGKYQVGWCVDPCRTNGVAIPTLCDHLLEAVLGLGADTVVADTREDREEHVGVLFARGFEMEMRFPVSELMLADFDGRRFASRVESVQTSGVRIASIAELMDEYPDWRERVYELNWAIVQDMPAPEPMTRQSWDYFLKKLKAPGFLASGNFYALDGDDWVGASTLWAPLSTPRKLLVGLTGVSPSHRRRGVATALKVRAIEFAQRRGAVSMETDNEENNPMFGINVNLGFRPKPAWISCRKELQK